MKKNQSNRLTKQQKKNLGAVGIFGEESQKHDSKVHGNSQIATKRLEKKYPTLTFRHRKAIKKSEINEELRRIDPELGQTLFVESAEIRPDGGIIEVVDDNGKWRVILTAEAKHQGKDIENIKKGILVGKNNDQDTMAAGNAIERAHKNIAEMANYMLSESHFPYVLFLEGSNFLTCDVVVRKPDGSEITLKYNDGSLNRLDRLTASNYGLPINTNLCENKFVTSGNSTVMLQAASIYTQGNGECWKDDDMLDIMLDVAETSIRILAKDLFKQLTENRRD